MTGLTREIVRAAAGIAWLSVFFLAAAPSARALVISEIMYHPCPSGVDSPCSATGEDPYCGDGVEYLEIYNEDAEARDLSHYYFSRGVNFSFPGFEDGGSVFIRGKSYLVVTADVEKLLALYPYLDNSDPLFPAVVGPPKEQMCSFGRLDNTGERITLNNPGGAEDAEVRYNNRGGWPAAADGTRHSLILRNPELDDPEDGDNWSFSPLQGGSPGLANSGETIFTDTLRIASGDRWRILKGTAEPSDPKDAWRGAGFDDGAWTETPSPVGFGDACYANGTVLPDMLNGYLSVYLRKSFEIPDPDEVDVLILRIASDDGFIAYLNGQEVAKRNMNNGDAYDAGASGTGECTARNEYVITEPRARIVAGTNVLCLQVHNRLITDADFGVIPELISRQGESLGGAPRVDVDLNELYWNVGAQGPGPWLELYNDQDAEQDISGYFLSDDAANLRKYTFPEGTKIAARGYLVVEQAAVQAAGVVFNRLVPATERTKFIALSRELPGQPPERSLQVVDAYRFRITSSLPPLAPEGMSDARYPDGDRDWIIARTPTRGAANQFQVERRVVLNEIMFHPFHPFKDDHVPGENGFEKPEEQGEYLEIFNRGLEAVDIGGWSISQGVDYIFPRGRMIQPGEYLVIARDPDYLKSHYGLPAAQVLGPWGRTVIDPDDGSEDRVGAVLADGGERVELSDAIGNRADTVRYADNHRWSQWADTRGSSLERVDPNQDGRRPGNWDASDESGKSEWKHYSYRGRYTEAEKELEIILLTRGIVLMDNLKVTDPANPAAGNYIRNGDFEATPLGSQWLLDGTHIHSGRITYDKKDGEACLKIISTGRGNNRLDRIKYVNPAFPTNRELLLEFDAKWICGEATLMFSGTWNTFAQRFFIEVPQRNGTPGRQNSVRERLAEGNQGPLVEQVRQDPVLPGPGEEVVVSAEVTDADGVRSVKLRWAVDSIRAAASEVEMLDDGQGPDRKAGDGTYTCTVPGQPTAGKRIAFHIEAADARGNAGRFPYDDRMRTHPYLLDPATADLAKLRWAMYVHAAPAPAAQAGVPEYRMLMSTENVNYLTTRRVMNNDLVDSSFVFNNSKIWYNIGVRYGNSPWTRPGGKSYVVKLPRADELQGYKKFKLDNRGSEINERVVYYLIRSSNVPGRDPAPYARSTYARPFLNAQPTGVFERVEIPGKQFVERWWPNDAEGIFYKLDDKFLVNADGSRRAHLDAFIQHPPDRSGNGDDIEEYRWYFLHRTREKYDDFSELIELAKFFTASKTPQAVYDAELFDRVNVESLIRTLAVEINVGDWDTWGTTRGKNCYFYRPRVDGRWTLVGWDKDLTLANPGDLPLVPTMFPETARLLNSAGGKRAYYSILDDMLARFYKAEYLNLFFNNHARDRDGKLISGIPSSASAAAGFLTSRAGIMRGVLPRNVQFDLLTGGAQGELTSTQPELTVEGNAPLTLWTIVVTNPAQPLWFPDGTLELILDVNRGSFTWPGTTRWKTVPRIPVVSGVNDLVFTAYGSDGQLIGTDRLRVLYNLNWDPPEPQKVTPNRGPAGGGTEVVIEGTGFRTGAKAFFGPAQATVTAVNETAGTISARTPAGTVGTVEVKVQNLDGKSGTLAAGFTYGSARFNRGDVDASGKVELNDAILILSYQFFGGTLGCLDAADVNDDGEITVTDPVNHLNYQFLGAAPPAAPFDPDGVAVGEDPTPEDPLGCETGR